MENVLNRQELWTGTHVALNINRTPGNLIAWIECQEAFERGNGFLVIAQDAIGSGQPQKSRGRVRIQLYSVLATMDGHLGRSIFNEKPSQPEPWLNGAGAQVNRPLECRFRYVTLSGPRHEQHQSVGGLDLGVERKEPSRALKKRQAFAGKSRV